MSLNVLAVAIGSMAAVMWLIGRLLPWLRATSAGSVPSGGGVAIVVMVLAVALAAGIADPASAYCLAGGLVPAACVAAVSLRDDFRPLSPLLRLSVHIAAAIGVVAALGPIDSIAGGPLGSIDLGALAWPLTVLWIVGVTNAFNFMDGIDGIAGITATTAAAAIAIAAALFGSQSITAVGVSCAAGCLGFLAWNWPPARVFMGDVGSTFCGFIVAVFPLLASGDRQAAMMSVVIMACWPFLFDSGYTLVRRLLRGENILEQHTSHLYQRLVTAGWSHRGVSSLYGGLSAMSAAMAISPLLDPALRPTTDFLAPAVILVGIALLLVLPAIRPAPQSPGIRA